VPRYVLIGNPGSKRCALYIRELTAFRADRGERPDVEIVPWADVVPQDGDLAGLPAFDRPAVVRLESPGKSADVYRLLLEAGARDDPVEPPRDWRGLPICKGQLVRPGLWYRGFRRVLAGLRRSFDVRPHLAPTACPLAVAATFDKAATNRRLAAAGVPVPEWRPADELPDGGVGFHCGLHDLGWPSAFAKLNTGASAVGIVAGYFPPEGASFGLTTLARIGDDFFSTRRVRRISSIEMVLCLRFLRGEGAIVQRGVAKARIDGEEFDLRVVCVGGRPAATIFRLSPHPMTNLHLGGRRGEFARCRAAIPTRAWLDALDQCEAAAACFSADVVGVDAVFERGFGRSYVLEVNAFGDFVPGWTDPAGRSVHAIELATAANRGTDGGGPAVGT
jgi:hypothetical protein